MSAVTAPSCRKTTYLATTWLLSVAFLGLGGCLSGVLHDDACGPTDQGVDADMAGVPPDLAVPAAKCAAAKGLTGDNLLCVDFDKVTQLTDAALAGWNFNANMANCWQITGGALQLINFGSFMGNCGATLPSIDLKQADKQKYQRVTLALIHKVDMSDPDQQAQIFLDVDSPARLAHQLTGKPGFPTLVTTTLTVSKADLPMGLMSIYKFYLKGSALNIVGGRLGWQIQSIAIMGNL